MRYKTVSRFFPETPAGLILRALFSPSGSRLFGYTGEEERLGKQLGSVCDVAGAILMPSARAALYWMLRALKPARLYLPAYLCSSVYECALRAGIPMTYLDLVPGSYNTRLDGVNYEASSALLLVHQYGIPSDPEYAREVARKYGLMLIEDNAAAFGATWNGVPTGSFGEASIISFEYSKIISACKGGAGLFREQELADRVGQYIREKTTSDYLLSDLHWFKDALEGIFYAIALRPLFYGSVALPLFRFFHGPFMDRSQTIRLRGTYRSDFGTQRATLASQMISRLPEIVSARRNVAAIYEQVLSDLKEVELMRPPSQAKPAYTHYPILVPRGTRDRVVKEIWARGVDPGFNFSYLCGGEEAAAVARVSEDYTHRIVTLPVSSRITPELAEAIALAFRDAAVAAGLS